MEANYSEVKYFGCKYKTGHLRHNQNCYKWFLERMNGTYTHFKYKSINDDRHYLQAKRFLKKNGFVRQYHYNWLMKCNPYHYKKILKNVSVI